LRTQKEALNLFEEKTKCDGAWESSKDVFNVHDTIKNE
jgi:hypothetical protein